MAEGKNKIIIYRDWISTFNTLEPVEAGRLIQHLFAYVNDQNPEPPDRLTALLFEPIKNQLKRDLRKWEQVQERNSNNGKLGGRPKKENPKEPTETQNNPVGFSETQNNPEKGDTVIIDTVIVDTVISDNDILLKKESKKEISKNHLIDLFPFQEDFREIWDSWIQYKKVEHKKTFKRIETEQAAFKLLLEKSKGNSLVAEKIIQQSIANNWQGLFELKTEKDGTELTKAEQREQAMRDYLNR